MRKRRKTKKKTRKSRKKNHPAGNNISRLFCPPAKSAPCHAPKCRKCQGTQDKPSEAPNRDQQQRVRLLDGSPDDTRPPQQDPIPPHLLMHTTMQTIINATNTSGKIHHHPNTCHMILSLLRDRTNTDAKEIQGRCIQWKGEAAKRRKGLRPSE